MSMAQLCHTLVLLQMLLYWHFSHCGPIQDVFKSDQSHAIMRLAKSAEMRNYMQPNVNPCHDFYKFSCGNWHKINPAHSDAQTGMFRIIAKGFNRKLAQLLRAPKSSSESDMERKVKYFYESCVNAATKQHNYQQYLQSVMEEFGGMPALMGDQWQADEFDWLNVIAKILRKYGKQIILSCDISNDLTNNEINRLYIGQLDELVTSRATEYYMHLSVLYKMDLKQMFGMSNELASKTAQEIVDFERKLATGIVEEQEGLGMEDKTRLRMLEEMTESYKPELNFTRYVSTWLGYEYRTPVYEYVEGYLRNLRSVMAETPKEVVANYIMWQLLQNFRLEVDKTNKPKQAQKCLAVTKLYFYKYLDHMVYEELMKTDPNTLQDIDKLWSSLKQAFEVVFKSNNSVWSRESIRDKALEKLSAMQLQINAYELKDIDKEFAQLVVNTDAYFENVMQIMRMRGQNYRQRLHEPPRLEDDQQISYSPAYIAEFNKVIMPVAFLQPRYLWDDVYPAALRFATAGYIIAHEMAHGFDDSTRKYDAKGNLNNWWDRNSTEIFAKRKECLRQQYGEFKYAGKMLPKINNQGENIADNVGIRVAYEAYEQWLREHVAGASETLPQLAYTPRQLFFIGSAQLWCSDINRQWRQLLASTDVHAPEEVRVLAMMSNFDMFSSEFKCIKGSKMNPHRKCVVY